MASMEVEKEGAAKPVVRADDDPAAEGQFMRLSQLRFRLTSPKITDAGKTKDWEDFIFLVQKFNAVTVYETTCKELSKAVDSALVTKMKEENSKKMEEFEAFIADAKENEGETEVRDGLMAKAQLLARSADKATAVTAYEEAEKLPKTTSGQKLDLSFNLMRIGMFWNDIPLVDTHCKAAKVLIDNGGDWERRNRLKVYEATYLMSIRDFKKAAALLLDSISTFTAVEIYSYNQFVFYTVVCATVALDRKTIRDKVVNAPEILQVVHDAPALQAMMTSLYECRYKDLFVALVEVVEQLHLDLYFAAHARYFLRQSRIVAYTQYLESYHTVEMASMAATFGLSVPFLDRELSDLVASGRLSCKIDKVKGVVCSNRPDEKNSLYQRTIKHGDALLNRIQKLSRVITI